MLTASENGVGRALYQHKYYECSCREKSNCWLMNPFLRTNLVHTSTLPAKREPDAYSCKTDIYLRIVIVTTSQALR